MPATELHIQGTGLDLQAFFNDAVTGIAIIGLNGRFSAVNPAFCRLLGYSEDELLGQHPAEITHPSDRKQSLEVMDRLLGGLARTDQAQKRYLRSDGSAVQVMRTTTLLRDGEGRPAGLFTQVVDMTTVMDMQESVRQSESRYRALVAHSSDLTLLIDREGRIIYSSPASMRVLGYDSDEVLGRSVFEFIFPEQLGQAHDSFAHHVSAAGLTVPVRYKVQHHEGSWRFVEVVTTSLLDDPAVGALVANVRDVTDQVRYQGQLEAGERRVRALVDIGNLALEGGPLDVLFNQVLEAVRDRLDVANGAIVRFESSGEYTVMATTNAQMSARLYDSGSRCPIASTAQLKGRSAVWSVEVDGPGLLPIAGDPTIGRAAVVPIKPAEGRDGVLAAYSADSTGFTTEDVAFLESLANILAAALSRRNIEEELRRQAVQDGLTGLPNRVLLMDRLGTALARLERSNGAVGVLFVDIDNFKLVNDSLGHSTGDAVVAALATRLREATRPSDTVARFGGDEFVIISEGTDHETTRELAERLRTTIGSPLAINGELTSVTGSIGYAVTSDPGASAEAIMANADMAMYAAKQSGKNAVAGYTPELRQRTTDQLETVSGIRRGLSENEFVLYYQPIVHIERGEVIGHEALIRWRHPTAGVLAPGQFIDYAESSGLILPLGEWVLRTACEQSAQWRRAGRTSAVSINVSPLQLTGSDIVGLVESALADSGALASDVSLEVTESAMMADLARARSAVEGLRRLGVYVGMDDFGTGWSSLSHLAGLPFDFIKIDRSFVLNLHQDERTAAMLGSIVALCGALRLRVIVEGVETDAQLEYLKRLEVRMVQGYLFGRPAAAEL